MRLASNIRLEPSRRQRTPAAVSATRGFLPIRQQRAPIAFESSFERDLLVICGATPQVLSVVREPFSIRFLEQRSSKDRVYTPDFLISLRSGPIAELLVEVKRHEDQRRYGLRDAARHDAARLWAEQRQARYFDVVTDKWMTAAGLDQFRLIHGHAATRFDVAVAAEIVNEISELGWLTTLSVCERLGAASGLTWNRAMPMMLALVAAGQLRFDVTQALTLESPIYAGSIPNPFDGIGADEST